MKKIKTYCSYYYWKIIAGLYRYFQKKLFNYLGSVYSPFKETNPIEIVYSSLLEVYNKHLNGIFSLQIMGIEVQPINELGEVNVNITLKRPGFLIGKYGEDINKLEEVISKKFDNRKVHINPIELKDIYGFNC